MNPPPSSSNGRIRIINVKPAPLICHLCDDFRSIYLRYFSDHLEGHQNRTITAKKNKHVTKKRSHSSDNADDADYEEGAKKKKKLKKKAEEKIVQKCNFFCEYCPYSTSHKGTFARHVRTKHNLEVSTKEESSTIETTSSGLSETPQPSALSSDSDVK